MSYFVTITFDLRYADTSIYPRIHSDLENLDFSKFIKGKRKTETKLPSNTFVAIFDTDEFENKKELKEWLKEEIKYIFRKHDVSGKYFIAIGSGWSWSVGSIQT